MPSCAPSSAPAPSQRSPRRWGSGCTIAATRPSSGSCSRPPIRSGELIGLSLDDLDLIGRLITIRRGKGGPGRTIPIGQATTEALLAYLDERAQHPLADAPDLWLGNRGKRFGREGLSRSLRRRAERAGVQDFRPHRFRHTAAHRWLAAGGSESALMAIAGWTRTDMLVGYTRAHAAERAAMEARRLNLGDL